MQIQSLAFHFLEIPLKFQFSQSNNTTHYSSAVIVQIQSTRGVKGIGECCPRSYVTGETLHTVATDLKKIEPLLLSTSFETLESIRQFVINVLPGQIGLSSICALDLALIDAWSKEYQQNLVEAVGGKIIHTVEYTGILPQAKPAKLEELLHKLSYFSFKELKIKVDTNLDRTLEVIRLIRASSFSKAKLRIDANCAWSYDDAISQIPVLMEKGIIVFEQLFPKDELNDLMKITRQFGKETKIMADESLTSLRSANQLINERICNHFNLKISKNGGFWNTLRLYQYITGQGFSCQLGAHFGETSILTAAGLLLASKADQLTAVEGGYGEHILTEDIISPSLKFDSNARIYIQDALSRPGLIAQERSTKIEKLI